MQRTDIGGLGLDLLLLLEALFEQRTVTGAGDRIGLSQPAASRALARLRSVLGDPLFVRGPRQLEPTRRALAIQPALERALAEVRALAAPVSFEPAYATGTLRILVPDSEAVALVPGLLAVLERTAPGLDVALAVRRGDPLAMLAEDAIDLAIGVFEETPAGYRRQRLFTDDFVCLVRRGHPVLRTGLTLQRFATMRHALVSISGEGGGAVDARLAERGLSRRIALRLPQFMAAPFVVARSDLVITLPRRLARAAASLAPLEMLEPPLPLDRFDVSQLWHERQHPDPRHAWLRRTVADLAAGEGPSPRRTAAVRRRKALVR